MSWGMRATPARRARDARRREEQVQTIADDKLVEFTSMCDEGQPDGCFSLAEWHAVVAKDHEAAGKLYAVNCLERKHAPSCHHLGVLHANGRGVKRSMGMALDFFRRSCDLEHPAGCYLAGRLQLRKCRKQAARAATSAGPATAPEDGAGASTPVPSVSVPAAVPAVVAAAVPVAVRSMDRACGMGDASACSYLGSLLAAGDPAIGLTPRLEEARRLLTLGCDMHEGAACKNLAVMYYRGDGMEKNRERANDLMQRAKELFAAERGDQLGRK